MTTYQNRSHPCADKVRYATQTEALAAAARSAGKHNTSHLRTYPCLQCHGWHLTRQAKR